MSYTSDSPLVIDGVAIGHRETIVPAQPGYFAAYFLNATGFGYLPVLAWKVISDENTNRAHAFPVTLAGNQCDAVRYPSGMFQIIDDHTIKLDQASALAYFVERAEQEKRCDAEVKRFIEQEKRVATARAAEQEKQATEETKRVLDKVMANVRRADSKT